MPLSQQLSLKLFQKSYDTWLNHTQNGPITSTPYLPDDSIHRETTAATIQHPRQ